MMVAACRGLLIGASGVGGLAEVLCLCLFGGVCSACVLLFDFPYDG